MGVLNRIMELIAEHSKKLDEIANEHIDLRDWRILYATLHLLQVHAQGTIDALLHICSLLSLEASTPMMCVEKLQERNILNTEEATLLKRMIRFRNIIVHEYGRIDVSKVLQVLNSKGYRKPLEILTKILKILADQGIVDP